ncbi:MAG: hypothetical protein GY794_11870 [bacterium]|nr:hypothetical protein [bacterium]
MSTKSTDTRHHKTCLDTLKGLQTLVEMQQMLILQAIEQFSESTKPTKKNKPRSKSTAGKKSS